MKTLKMRSLKSVLIYIIIFLGFGIYSSIRIAPSLSYLFKEPTPIENVDFSKDIDGLYVSATIYGNYGCFYEETDDGEVTGREYFVDAGADSWLTMRAEGDDIAAAEHLLEMTYQHVSTDASTDARLTEAQYEVTGVINFLSSESYQVFDEIIQDGEASYLYVPYSLHVNHLGAYTRSELMMLSAVTALFFIIAIVFIILIISGNYQRVVKKYIANSPSPELTLEKIENFIKATPEVNGLRYNEDFICGDNKGLTVFGEISKIAWIYKQTINHKRYFITVDKTYVLVLGFTDGTSQAAVVKNERSADEHILNLQKLCPQAVFGYTKDLERLFHKNLSEFLALRYNQPEDTQQKYDF